MDKDGPRIQSWMSQGTPRLSRLCTLTKSGAQIEMLMNEITGVSSKIKRNFNPIAEDEKKKKIYQRLIGMKRKIYNLLVDCIQ